MAGEPHPVPAPAAPSAPPADRPWHPVVAAGRVLRRLRQRPLRTLKSIVFGLVILAGLGAAGMYGWFRYHFSAARESLARGHNAEAARHLQSCRWVRPHHPEVRL